MAKRKCILDLPVAFGGFSAGKTTARLGVAIGISDFGVDSPDEAVGLAWRCFAGHRLTGRIVLGNGGAPNGQKELIDDLHEEVSATFDVKHIGANASVVSLGLAFSIEDVDVKQILGFAKRSGRMIVETVAALPEPASESDDDDEEEDEGGDDDEGEGGTATATRRKARAK